MRRRGSFCAIVILVKVRPSLMAALAAVLGCSSASGETIVPSASAVRVAMPEQQAHEATSKQPQKEPAPAPAKSEPVDENVAAVQRILGLSIDASTSLGQPADGSIEDSVELPARGPGFIANPKRPVQARFGSVVLVQTLLRAAADVGVEESAAPLVINDIGLQRGGPIAQHGSHQNGHDVDVLFFVRDDKGHPHRSVGVPIAPDGMGVDFKDLADPSDDQPVKLDVPRTWRLMASLIKHAGDQLQRVFIVEHVRSMLLKEAQHIGANAAIQERFSDIACQPGTPHDDHMHLRFFCSPHDMAAGCRDKPPVYPFRREQLAALGLKPQLGGPVSRAKKAAKRKRTTTPEQARKRAGRMHSDVIAFLDLRKSWLKKATPPRPYCR